MSDTFLLLVINAGACHLTRQINGGDYEVQIDVCLEGQKIINMPPSGTRDYKR